MPKPFRRAVIAAASMVLLATGLAGIAAGGAGASTAGSSPGVTATTVKVGIISDLTGAAASTFEDAAPAMEARFKQVNAAGGVNGRKIVWSVADTTSTPAGAETAAKSLVQSKGVFLVSAESALTFGGSTYLQQAGVPVIGSSVDGPEWYEQPNTNMFNITGNDSPSEPGYTDGGFWKKIGATKVSFIASNTPSSTRGVNPFEADMKLDGLSVCDNTIVPLGGVNFTTYALSFKTAGCNGVECSCVLSSSLAMATALKQDGLTNVKISACCASQDVYASPEDLAAANGVYFSTYVPPNAAGNTLLAGLKKYDSAYKGGVPDLGAADGWEVANLTVEALQVAGKNPTRSSLITNLRNVTSWTDNGLAASPVDFKTFGQAPATTCTFDVQFVNKKFVPFPKSGKPFCGRLIPGSGTPPS
ncbi:MAG TPA: ABC transporter substrate-binding protein [Acidimicrobiales bacterium]